MAPHSPSPGSLLREGHSPEGDRYFDAGSPKKFPAAAKNAHCAGCSSPTARHISRSANPATPPFPTKNLDLQALRQPFCNAAVSANTRPVHPRC